MAATKKILNLNLAKRGTEVGFFELVPNILLGPEPNNTFNTALLPGAQTITPNVNVVIWDLVDSMNDDLKAAIIQFIDKDKSGSFVVNLASLGRTKTITFEFQGTPSKIYQFGELGFLNLVLSYPPGAKFNLAGGTTNTIVGNFSIAGATGG
jgi:hypothetical protein